MRLRAIYFKREGKQSKNESGPETDRMEESKADEGRENSTSCQSITQEVEARRS